MSLGLLFCKVVKNNSKCLIVFINYIIWMILIGKLVDNSYYFVLIAIKGDGDSLHELKGNTSLFLRISCLNQRFQQRNDGFHI